MKTSKIIKANISKIKSAVEVRDLIEMTASLILSQPEFQTHSDPAVDLINTLKLDPLMQNETIAFFEKHTHRTFHYECGKYRLTRKGNVSTSSEHTSPAISTKAKLPQSVYENYQPDKFTTNDNNNKNLDATKDYYAMYRDNGRFGSHPSHDDFGDESDA